MKRTMQNHFGTKTLTVFTFLIMIAVLVTPAVVISQEEEYPGQGKDQLVKALDASIARVIDSGQWRAIVNSDPVAGPLMVNIGDCYPRITDGEDVIYPFPQKPVGLLKEILDTKEIFVGDYDVNDPFVPGTFHVFDNVNPALLRAIIDELGLGYGLDPVIDPITITPNYLWPPSSALMFERLALGRHYVDPVDPLQKGHDINGFNAALGATVGVDGVEKRRRDVALFTCTVFGTAWYIHVRDDSTYQTLDDVIADTTADLCVGQLSSRLSEDYFKNAASIAKQFTTDDLVVCSEGVRDGTYDAYLHFDPEPYLPELRSIPMQIVSGIPIWVAREVTDSTTTTSTKQDCIIEKIFSSNSEKTALLRNFRDEVLSKTAAGRELINLYYQWSPAIGAAMLQDETLGEEIQRMVDGILPLVRRAVE